MDQGRPHSDCTSPLHRGQYQLIEGEEGGRKAFVFSGRKQGGGKKLTRTQKERAGEKQECEEHLAFVKDSLLSSRPEKHASKVERGLAESSIRERKPSGSTVK